MIKKVIKPGYLEGSINAVPSKSYMQRALALAMLNKGKTRIRNADFSMDSLAALNIIRDFGAEIDMDEDDFIINGLDDVKYNSEEEINVNAQESGLSFRMFSIISSIFNADVKIQASGSLMERNISDIENILKSLEIKTFSIDSHPPLIIRGKLKVKNKISLDAGNSSQAISGLLIALAKLGGMFEVEIKNIKSRPYIEMTLSQLSELGVKSTFHENTIKLISLGLAFDNTITIEGDWSSASNYIVGAIINGNIEIKGLNKDSLQADKRIMDLINSINCQYKFDGNTLKISKQKLKSFYFDASNSPDLFPPLVALACYCDGISEISGTHRLYNKESNRAIALKTEFEKLGAKIDLEDDKMLISSNGLIGASVDTHNDHRIAMALTIAGIGAEEEITLYNPNCVEKSYPEFWEDFDSLFKIL